MESYETATAGCGCPGSTDAAGVMLGRNGMPYERTLGKSPDVPFVSR